MLSLKLLHERGPGEEWEWGQIIKKKKYVWNVENIWSFARGFESKLATLELLGCKFMLCLLRQFVVIPVDFMAVDFHLSLIYNLYNARTVQRTQFKCPIIMNAIGNNDLKKRIVSFIASHSGCNFYILSQTDLLPLKSAWKLIYCKFF